jgi:hypothetical protein
LISLGLISLGLISLGLIGLGLIGSGSIAPRLIVSYQLHPSSCDHRSTSIANRTADATGQLRIRRR